MKIPGFLKRTYEAVSKAFYPVHSSRQGWLGTILEPFAGAWQRNITAERKDLLVTFSAVFACISLIAEDIAKLDLQLMEEVDGICVEVERETPYAKVLEKPNDYQTIAQFLVQWIIMKLLYGNVYVLKEREGIRGIVRKMHVLDSRLVTPLVADDGSVFYDVSQDRLSGVKNSIRIPASEIIHDRGLTLFHPLVGISPIYACGASATQGIRIQYNSLSFFENMSRPSGVLTTPGHIENDTAERLKTEYEKNFGGGNLGRLLIGGDGLKYEAMTIPAADAQLIEQLRWTVEDVARCFRVPLHKIASGVNPTFNNVGALNQDYYSQTLQYQIESIEQLLEEGLELDSVKDREYEVEFDLEGLLRMDPIGRAEAAEKGVRGGWLTPNEARQRENLPPLKGGDTAYMQQQNFSLAALDERDRLSPLVAPPSTPSTPALPAPASEDTPDNEDTLDNEDTPASDDNVKHLVDKLVYRFTELANVA